MPLRMIHAPSMIARRCQKLGVEISAYYAEKKDLDLIIFIPLSGAFIFAADLLREITVPLEVTFIQAASYQGKEQGGEVILRVSGGSKNLYGKDVLIVEDIIHTGKTLSALMGYIDNQEPRSVEVCAFLKHPDSEHQKIVKWVGFTALPDEFVVGYGMDLEERMRNHPGVMIIE